MGCTTLYVRICRLSVGYVTCMLGRDEPFLAERRKAQLTPRERQIPEAMLTAASNKDIAVTLGIREQSVKNELTALYIERCGVGGRLELVLKLMNGDA